MAACIPKLYDAAMSSTHWTQALNAVCSNLPVRGAMLYAMGNGATPYSVNTSNSIYHGLERKIAEYVKLYGHYDAQAVDFLMAHARCSPVRDTDIWPDLEELQNREDIVYTREELGIYRRVSFNISASPFQQAFVIFQFDKSLKNLSELTISNATILAPHLAKVLEISQFYAPLRYRYKAVLSVLNRMNVGICICSVTGECIVVNDMANRLFEEKDSLWLSNNRRVKCIASEKTSQIQGLIQKCSQTADGTANFSGAEISLKKKSGGDPVLLLLTPLRDVEQVIDRNFSGCMLMIVDPAHPVTFDVSPLVQVFGWTLAETDIAGHLMTGLSIDAIADNRSVAPITIRNQIKSLYHKMGVCGRHEFTWKTMQYNPPII